MAPDAADWTAPGAFEVAPGVHRIPLPLPSDALRAVNVYALDGGDGGCVLIDAGWALAESRRALEVALGQLGYGLDDVRRFLVTHAHRDHYTLGVELRRTFGSRLAIGRGEQPNLDATLMETAGRLPGLLAGWGAAHLVDAWAALLPEEERAALRRSYEPPDEWIADGARLDTGKRTLTAVPTPGHTRGHLVFRDEGSDLLFTGDHVLPHITPSIGFEPARGANPLGDYLASLHLLLESSDAVMLPAHGAPGGPVHARVQELLAHHDERLAATLAAVAAGSGTALETARALGWTRRLKPFDGLDVFNQVLAVGETAAHLTVLCERGQVRETTGGAGVLGYEAAG